jgi:hypothetical protein
MKQLVLLSLLLTSIAFSEPVKQSHVKQHGELQIFYSAFDSSFLTPEIAVANNFVRGKDRGLVNIAVVKTLGTGIPANVTGQVQNIFQQTQQLEFVAIKEQSTVYYLAPFDFENEDLLTFKINVTAGDSKIPYDFKFQKKMYHNP